jgi:hypothetical protein
MIHVSGSKGNSVYGSAHTTLVSDFKDLIKALQKSSWENKVNPGVITERSRQSFLNVTLKPSFLEFKIGSPEGCQLLVVTIEGDEKTFLQQEIVQKGKIKIDRIRQHNT